MAAAVSGAPISATLFVYQVGFGDCFLLRFDYQGGERRHVLIDFGTTGLPFEAERSLMTDVARDIAARCSDQGGVLDIVVATHRHADHISGFATKRGTGPGDIIRALAPKLVIMPWTEAPDAPVDWLGPEDSATSKAFAMRRQSLAAMHETARLALQALDDNRLRLSPAVADQLCFVGEDNLSNKSAVDNLLTMGAATRFVFHGCDLALGDLLPGVQVDVLGPPTLRQTETIRKQRARDVDEFWHLAPQRVAETVSAAADDDSEDGAERPLFPGWFTYPATKLRVEQRWLQERIDEVNGELLLGLVRALDGQMNNTSVILLLRAGSKSLLFPGDAQLENWRYALQSPLAPLLDDVDLYKVGHHGSLNATPRSMWNRFAKKGNSKRRDRLTTVMSTRANKHGDKERNTEVPRRKLVDELRRNSDLHNTQDLPDKQLCEEITFDLS